MKMSEWQNATAEFHREVMDKDPSRKAPVKMVGLHEPVLWASLLLEEVTETVLAINRQDFVETIDGVIDTFYIGLGSCNRWGADTSNRMMNLASQRLIMRPPIHHHQGIVLFGKTASSFVECILKAGDRAVRAILKKKDVPYCTGSIFQLFEELQLATDMWGVDLEPFFAEVHRTNMLKGGGEFDGLGKLLKPEDWEPPRIKELLEEQGLL